jgi:Glycosyltransferase 61
VEIALEDFSSYRVVDTFADLTGPGSRLLRVPAESVPRTRLVVAAGQPRFQHSSHKATPIELRCARVARALCLRGGVIVDLDTRRVLPDVIRKPPRVLPHSVDVDLSPLGIDDPAVEWELLPARTEKGPGFYADCWNLGYGHVLLEGLSRCWALDHMRPIRGVVVANKRARGIYLPWFEAMGIGAAQLRSTRREPLRVDNLLVPSQSYVVDRGMSSRFHEVTRGIAREMGAARGCPRLFVSRRDASKRRLVNEVEIEELFNAKGFRIFHPEEHTVEEQVRAFAGASLVAGPVGSGLYSVAFSPPTTRLIVLAPAEFYTPNDRILAGARDHAPVFAFGRSQSFLRRDAMLSDWHLDPEAARVALERVLADDTANVT